MESFPPEMSASTFNDITNQQKFIIINNICHLQALQSFQFQFCIQKVVYYQYFLVSHMSNKKKIDKKLCNRHIFSLKPKSQACFYQQQIQMKFCDQGIGKVKNTPMKKGECYQGPIFNHDRNGLTSAFIINSDKKNYLPSQKQCPPENLYRYQNFNDQRSEILIPKPSARNIYCNVCKEKFEEYLEHISSRKHKKRIKINKFNHYILELEAKYAETRPRLGLKQKEKDINTEGSNLIVINDQDSDESIELSKVRKKVKTDVDMGQENTLVYSNGNQKYIPYQYNPNSAISMPDPCYWNMFSMPFTIQYPLVYTNHLIGTFNMETGLYYTMMQNQMNEYIKQCMMTAQQLPCYQEYGQSLLNHEYNILGMIQSTINICN